MLEKLSKNLTVVTAAVLALSVIYDFFLLHALGLTFAEVPTTIADHVRSAIIWLPVIGIFGLVGGILGLAQKPRPAVNGATASHKLDYVDIFFFCTALPILIGIGLRSTATALALTVASFSAMLWFRFQLGHANIEAKLGAGAARLLMLALVAILLVAGKGYSDGTSAMLSHQPTLSAHLRLREVNSTAEVTLIRRFDSVALLVEPDARVRVVPADAIVVVTPLASSPTLLRCRVVPSLCKPEK
ncbi:MAG: hypothetical protein K5880_11745 [Hydrogenophaga sp.]|uniref:hypothetical protein n=1 Tax=Hydrogenophaga sp. TaxID=1904254 RepID=UPI002614BEF4|nr:hypothetical protein [Hydrogenophaga sp.]MCV0439298.1 hypothetical protein [Hydrogenophaga sp.]